MSWLTWLFVGIGFGAPMVFYFGLLDYLFPRSQVGYAVKSPRNPFQKAKVVNGEIGDGWRIEEANFHKGVMILFQGLQKKIITNLRLHPLDPGSSLVGQNWEEIVVGKTPVWKLIPAHERAKIT